jgi:hypothetical protein
MAKTTAADEYNAEAWLRLTDWELVERSASLGLPVDLHPDPYEPTGVIPAKSQLEALREAADVHAVGLTSAAFVKAWVAEHRLHDDHAYTDPANATHPPIPYYRHDDQLRGDGTVHEKEEETA